MTFSISNWLRVIISPRSSFAPSALLKRPTKMKGEFLTNQLRSLLCKVGGLPSLAASGDGSDEVLPCDVAEPGVACFLQAPNEVAVRRNKSKLITVKTILLYLSDVCLMRIILSPPNTNSTITLLPLIVLAEY